MPNAPATTPKCDAGNGKDSDIKGTGKIQMKA